MIKKNIAITFCFALSCVCVSVLGAKSYQRVMAKVGNEIITTWDIEEAVNLVRLGMSAEELASKEGKKRIEEAKATILERMIDEKLVVASAKKGPPGFADAVEAGKVVRNPYLPADTEIDSKMEQTFEQTRARFATQKDFEQEMRRERMTVRELRQRLKTRIRARLTYEKMLGVKRAEFRQLVRVSDTESKKFFKKEKSKFAVADQVRLRHILVSGKDKKLALDIKKRLEKGESFAKLAERYSKDKFTKSKGGRLGWVEKGQLRWPELEKAAFGAATGRASGPVKTSEGWHVIRVDDRKAGFDQEFYMVKARIKNVLYAQKIGKRVETWLKSLRDEHYVEILN